MRELPQQGDWDYIPNMPQSKSQRPLSAATLQLLRPLVKILLRNNVPHQTLAEWAKQAYVDVADSEFGIAGKKQTVSRIAILTGLTRKEVQRLLNQPETHSTPTAKSTIAPPVSLLDGSGTRTSETGKATLTRSGWKPKKPPLPNW